MRILHVIDFFQPVIGYQETFLAKAQLQAGHEVLVITSDRQADLCGISEEILGPRHKVRGSYVEEGIPVARLGTRWTFMNSVWLGGLKNRISDFKPDAIHVHGVASLTALRIALLRRELPHTTIVYDDHMTYGAMRGGWVSLLYRLFRVLPGRVILASADSLIAVTEETRDFMIRMYGFPADRIHIVPLGCDTTRFERSNEAGAGLREELGIGKDAVVFCYAGKIVREKGVDILIRASLEVMKNDNRVVVLCVGGRNDEYFSMIRGIINSSAHANRFHFVPHVRNDELSKYYSAADVGVWPRQCSLTMLEAMACSLPVIISHESGATERITDGKSGFFYSEGDVSDLADKMNLLLDINFRSQVANEARRYACRHDWSALSKSFEKFYETKSVKNER